MSKKSVVRGFGWKLAVAALVVAVVIGTTMAQPNGLNTGAAPTQSMGVSFTVNNIAELSVDPKNPTEADMTNDVQIVSVNDFGNLGTVRVKTNATAWDVLMKTSNGGRLIDAASGSKDSSANTNVWGDTIGWNYTYKGANTLIFKSGATPASPGNGRKPGSANGIPDTVLLRVAIGVAKTGAALGAGGANRTKLFPMSNVVSVGANPGVFAAKPAEVGFADIIRSKSVYNHGDSLAATITPGQASTIPISFAKEIGTAYGTGTPATSHNLAGGFSIGISGTDDGLASGTALGPAWSTVAGSGFSTPVGNAEKLEEYFYINVQVDQSIADLGANKSGNYAETFYLDLAVNF